jgi:DNA-binding response OmpR family regulator
MKILILEDDTHLCHTLEHLLTHKNRIIHTFANSDDASDEIIKTPFDLYILDINVQGSLNGYELAQYIKSIHKNAIILIISAITTYESVERVFNIGCADYIKKPFDLRELNLKINSLLKLYHQQEDRIDLNYGYVYDNVKDTLFYYDRAIDLTTKESLFLKILLKHQNLIVDNEKIMEYVWGKYVKPTTFRSIVFKLSQKINAGILINVKGRGYKIITTT